MADDRKTVIEEFQKAVNMTVHQIQTWLDTDDSKKVGQKSDDGSESIGHQSGKRIVELLGKKAADFDDDDLAHMKKVVSYVARHSAQKPDGDVTDTHWRFSLMNWGHDPLKNK